MEDGRTALSGGPRPRLGLPNLGDGVGLRGVHFHHLMHTPPGDNKCGGFGGCAVPISASQLYPKDGTMELFRFEKKTGQDGWTSVPTGETLLFRQGDNVHDVAWAAYKKVMGMDANQPPPPPTPLRLAFAPST